MNKHRPRIIKNLINATAFIQINAAAFIRLITVYTSSDYGNCIAKCTTPAIFCTINNIAVTIFQKTYRLLSCDTLLTWKIPFGNS